LLVSIALLSIVAGFGIHYALFPEETTPLTNNRKNIPQKMITHVDAPEPGREESSAQETAVQRFDGQRAYETAKMLCLEVGTRVEGSSQEKMAAEKLQRILLTYGCDRVFLQPFNLPDGKTSQNVVAVVKGRNPGYALVIGGHYDTRPTTTGGNDNASGAAVVIELARIFSRQNPYPTLYFVLFGAEEDFGEITPEHSFSHYGSRYFVGSMIPEMGKIIGMISLDMVGFGKALHIRYMGIGPMDLVNLIRDHAARSSFQVYLRKSGNLSDHEPFEKAGIPSAWLEYMLDPAGNYDRAVHTWEDDYRHVDPSNLQYVGDLVQSFLEGLRAEECMLLERARGNGY